MALTPSSPGCSAGSGATTCTETLPAVVGADVYALTLYQSADGSGSALATASVNAAVSLGVAANVSVTFGGVPASFVLSSPVITGGDDGGTHVATFTISALDASGATILQPGSYSAPIALSVSGDPNGALALSNSSIAAPGASSGATTVDVTYTGSKALTQATITATSGSAASSLKFIPIVVSANSLRDMFAGQSSKTVSVSELNYSGAFTISGASSVATTACTPASCTPATPGGSVTITLTPTTAGSATMQLGDSYGGSASIALGVGSTSFTVPISASAAPGTTGNAIAALPGGDIVVGASSKVYYFNPSSCETSCTPSSFSDSIGMGWDMRVGPDGNLYTLGASSIGKIPLSGCPSTCTPATVSSNTGGYHMAFGDDGNMWIINYSTTVKRVSTTGTVTAYTFTGYTPNFITAAPDGTIWFSDNGDTKIGHFDPNACTSTACTITSYAITKGTASNGITVDSSGNVWDAERYVGYVAEIVCGSSCTLTEFSISPAVSNLSWVEALPDGLIYANDLGNGKNDFIDPMACATGTCTLAYQSSVPPTYDTYQSVYGSDGAVWAVGTTGGLFRIAAP